MRTALITIFALTAATALAEGPLGTTMVATLLPPPAEIATTAAEVAPNTVAIPVLKQSLQKGETITAENLTTQTIPASQAFASTITTADELIGQQAIRPLSAGQPINRLHVRISPTVSRNQAVTFVFRKGGIELIGHGQALEDGQTGQSIRVVNPATRSTLVGVIARDGTVEIN